jgi:hypothetical protein
VQEDLQEVVPGRRVAVVGIHVVGSHVAGSLGPAVGNPDLVEDSLDLGVGIVVAGEDDHRLGPLGCRRNQTLHDRREHHHQDESLVGSLALSDSVLVNNSLCDNIALPSGFFSGFLSSSSSNSFIFFLRKSMAVKVR